jgi:hypothetical protein
MAPGMLAKRSQVARVQKLSPAEARRLVLANRLGWREVA